MPADFSLLLHNLRQIFPPKPQWTIQDIPDLTGKVSVVTGGYTGVGYETTKALVQHGARVYLFGRSASKAAAALSRLKIEVPEVENDSLAQFIFCDLSDLTSVRRAAEEFSSKESHLDMLYNNGGVMTPPPGHWTAQGYEEQFGVNTLSHFYLTKLLLPSLLASPFPRVVTTSSSGSYWHTDPERPIDFSSLSRSESENPAEVMTSFMLYGQSKLGNILFANELHRRYSEKGLISSSCHPGALRSELQRHTEARGPILSWLVDTLLLYPRSYGAITQLWSGTSEEGKTHGGKFLVPWAREGRTVAAAQDEALAKKLWDFMDEATREI